jgi:hypothetical protein
MSIKSNTDQLSPEDVVLGILASLRAAARAHYTAANVGWTLQQVAMGVAKGNELPPNAVRRGLMKEVYDEVIDILPDESPLREPLTKYREAEIQSIRDLPEAE